MLMRSRARERKKNFCFFEKQGEDSLPLPDLMPRNRGVQIAQYSTRFFVTPLYLQAHMKLL